MFVQSVWVNEYSVGDRKIIHVDMDCFYAAIEERENPSLKGKPIAVGGSSGRGVLTTCNYEARKYGCRSAMPVFKAKQLCPDLICLPVRFELYREASYQIRAIFKQYTDLVEPLSLDEAYLDVSHRPQEGFALAKEIREAIRAQTGLTASAGIGPNKLIAKIASDWEKPDGQFEVKKEKVFSFLASLPVRKLWGVGPKTAKRFAEMGIETCEDLRRFSCRELEGLFGRFGAELFDLCRGLDYREVKPNRIRKSLSNEHTFDKNLTTLEACRRELKKLVIELREEVRAKAADRVINKVFVKVKFSDFQRTTKECVCTQPRPSVFLGLLDEAWERSDLPVRLLGAGVRFSDGVEDEREGDEGQLWLDL